MRRFAVTAGLVLAMGCVGDEEGPAGVALEEFCGAWGEALCEGAARCGCGAVLGGLEACAEDAAVVCPLGEGSALRAMVDEGTLAYGEDAAGELVAALADGPCDAAICDGAGACIGLSAEGGPCGTSHGCRDGLLCIGGSCRRPRAAGDACGAGIECASGRCAEGACAEKSAEGEACAEDAECASGRCDFTTGRCGAPMPDGEYCMEHTDCVSGYCDVDGSTGSGAGRCAPRLADGESCDEDRQCRGGACYRGTCGALICRPLG